MKTMSRIICLWIFNQSFENVLRLVRTDILEKENLPLTFKEPSCYSALSSIPSTPYISTPWYCPLCSWVNIAEMIGNDNFDKKCQRGHKVLARSQRTHLRPAVCRFQWPKRVLAWPYKLGAGEFGGLSGAMSYLSPLILHHSWVVCGAWKEAAFCRGSLMKQCGHQGVKFTWRWNSGLRLLYTYCTFLTYNL